MAELSNNELNALLSDSPKESDPNASSSQELSESEVSEGIYTFFNDVVRVVIPRWTNESLNMRKLNISIISKTQIEQDPTMLGQKILISQEIKNPVKGSIDFLFSPEEATFFCERFLDTEVSEWNRESLNLLSSSGRKLFDMIQKLSNEQYGLSLEKDKIQGLKIPSISEYLEATEFVKIDFKLFSPVKTLDMSVLINLDLAKYISYIASNEPNVDSRQVQVRAVEFGQFGEVKKEPEETDEEKKMSNIDILLDVTMQLTVVLGKTKIKIKDALMIEEGTIIELQKLAGESVDVLVNDKSIAKGEVVVIDEYFGIRITEVISPSELEKKILKQS